MDFDLFVIGGGSAGVRCARISAGHGARVGIAEERHWGGTCVNIGCVPKKLLVQAGEYGGWAEDAAGFGWTIEKGPHDWGKLIAAKDREITRLEGIYRKLLNGAGATVFDGHATFVDDHTIEVAGQRVTAERIVIAELPGFTISFGLASSEQAGSFDEVVALADAALLAAKGGGRDQIVTATGDGQPAPTPLAVRARLDTSMEPDGDGVSHGLGLGAPQRN